jgi:4-diphosphocytidyl-2C-methyl-D-erythritol kinase
MSVTRRPVALRLLCPAKINLHLRVGPRRHADGFHPLLSWMVTVGLFDTLEFEPAAAAAAASSYLASGLSSGHPGAAGRDQAPTERRGALPRPPASAPRPAEVAPHSGPAGGASAVLPDSQDRPAEAASAKESLVTLVCEPPDLPCDERNLVARIAAAWGNEFAAGRTGRGSDATAATTAATTTAGGGVNPPGAREEGTEGVEGTHRPSAPRGTPPLPPGHAAQAQTGSASGPRITRLRARLTKRIPTGAGLGGGSSDGARALQAVNRLWRTDRPADELSAFAARFGSDLPFFLFGPSSVCTGRGEVVRTVAPPRPRWAVLVLPPVHMPTPDVYRRFDEMGLGRESDVAGEPDWAEWALLDASGLLPRLVNDLEPAAFSLRPDLGGLRQEMERALGRPVRMSGSGSSLFTLYDTPDEAREAARTLGGRRLSMQFRVEAVEIAPRIEDEVAAGISPD